MCTLSWQEWRRLGRGKKAVKPPVPVPNLLKVLPQRTDEYLATVIKFGGNAVGLTDFMPALGFNLTDRI